MTSIDSAAREASRWTQDFLKLYPPTFTGSDLNEDPQDFIDQIQKALDVMHVSGKETVELAAYRLKGRLYYGIKIGNDLGLQVHLQLIGKYSKQHFLIITSHLRFEMLEQISF